MRLVCGERRQHERFAVPWMYTPVWLREMEDARFRLFGHAYDVSRGGMRFELDEPIEPGRAVGVRIGLASAGVAELWRPRSVHAMATVIWVEPDDVESGGAVRMACAFRNFCGPRDEELLMRTLEAGRYRAAA